MLVGAFEIERGGPFQIGPLLQHEGVGRARIRTRHRGCRRPCPIGGVVDQAFEEALLGARLEPGVGALLREGVDDAFNEFARRIEVALGDDLASVSLLRNTVMGTPQARWRDTTQSGPVSTMPRMRFSPCGGTQRVSPMASSARPRSVSLLRVDRLIHGDEPLRRVAEDHGLLRAPGMGIVVRSRPRAISASGLDQLLDDRVVGVAEIALVVDDALALEAWRLFGEVAIGVDGKGDRRVDPLSSRPRRCLRPKARNPRVHDQARYGQSRYRCPPSHARRRAMEHRNRSLYRVADERPLMPQSPQAASPRGAPAIDAALLSHSRRVHRQGSACHPAFAQLLRARP